MPTLEHSLKQKYCPSGMGRSEGHYVKSSTAISSVFEMYITISHCHLFSHGKEIKKNISQIARSLVVVMWLLHSFKRLT